MTIDHVSFPRFAYTFCSVVFLVSITIAVCVWFFNSLPLILLSMLAFVACLCGLCALFAYGTAYVSTKRIVFSTYAKVSFLLFVTGAVGVRVMMFVDEFSTQARLVLVNDTGKDVEQLSVNGSTLGKLPYGDWAFSRAILYGNCDVKIEFLRNHEWNSFKIRGCEATSLGEFKIIRMDNVTSDRKIVPFQK